MKGALVVSTVAIIALAGLVAFQSMRIRDLERTLQQKPPAAEKPPVASLELQSKCAEQAGKFIKDWGYSEGVDHESHYSARLNRCFVRILRTEIGRWGKEKAVWTYRDVFDAIERKSYGTYSWHSVEGKKYWEVPPWECEARLPSGEKKACKSDEEFSELMKVYMEDAP